MSRNIRILGLVLFLCALPLTLRLIWEMTWLTWHDGPQMIGFSIVHAFPALLLFGIAAWLAQVVWAVVAAIMCIRKRAIQWVDLLLIGLSIAPWSTTFIPQGAWSSASESIWGLSPQAPELLVSAASYGQVARVRYLLDHGVSVSSGTMQACDAIAGAAGSKSPETVRLLLDHHASPNCFSHGTPPLMNAVEKGDLSSVKMLMSAGADPSARDKEGFTAYDDALVSNNKEMIQYLDSVGAH